MQIAWATDIHFDAAEPAAIDHFCTQIRRSRAEVLLIGGDISTGRTAEDCLRDLIKQVHLPVYFVLGNHDYYGDSIANVRDRMASLSVPDLIWLDRAGVVPLTDKTALVGNGGWADATLGDFDHSPLMTDFFAIEELFRCIGVEDLLDGFKDRGKLQAKLQSLGNEAAEDLRPVLERATTDFEHVLVLTHVPPFLEAAWYGGQISGDDWLPHVTCHAMGRVIRQRARAHPNVGFEVLCGHTHGHGESEIEPNLRVRTREAHYGAPDFVVLEVE
jgi:predicted phosphohydrolase